ncbi:MAG: glycosyltransferase family 4 protein, partial [Elusimicrobiaceae bacterium]|nr:glycosyltransferase family 4 protein [Elusimicrobiaceae bacterium]
SESTKRYLLAAQKYPASQVRLINNAPEQGKFFPDGQARQQMRQTYHYTEDQTVFLSVARLEAVKNPLLLLRAFLTVFQKNDTARLVLVGHGSLKKDLNDFIVKNKLQNAVFLAGEQHHVNDWLNMADAFVLPSEEESLPLSLLEALQAGKPCIVSNAGDMPRWVTDEETGFVVQRGDEKALSDAILRLAEQKNLREQMSEKTLKKSEEIKNMTAEYQHLYQQILEGSFHVKTL